ncbi:MAG: helix-turn-helix transcriptional regulator [bacterium]|nr:helix-turn-helix transcriptional regulator [bacterium]
MLGEIKKRIKELNLSLTQIAKALDCDTSYISRILNGTRSMPLDRDFLKKLANVLKFDEDIFLLKMGLVPQRLSALREPEVYKKVLDLIENKELRSYDSNSEQTRKIQKTDNFGEELL